MTFQLPLQGRKAWLITDDKVGMQVQVKGVADALGLDWTAKQVSPTGLWRMLAPFGPTDPKDKFAVAGSPLGPPWPEIAIATGRLSIPYIKAMRRHAGFRTYTVVLQDPRTGPRTSDLIWVPEHDSRRGANVITTLTAAHSFTPARLAALKATEPSWMRDLPHPRVGVILGGRSQVYRFTPDDDARLGAALAAIARLGASFMITPSRRTHQRLLRAADAATAGCPRILWDGTGANPYPQFLAHADLLVVTADSVNMTGEACATGRPVYVFEPSGGSAKFRRFHEALRSCGATRPLPDQVAGLDGWDYEPLDSAASIAAEAARRWARRTGRFAEPMAGAGRDPASRGQD